MHLLASKAGLYKKLLAPGCLPHLSASGWISRAALAEDSRCLILGWRGYAWDKDVFSWHRGGLHQCKPAAKEIGTSHCFLPPYQSRAIGGISCCNVEKRKQMHFASPRLEVWEGCGRSCKVPKHKSRAAEVTAVDCRARASSCWNTMWYCCENMK